VRLYILLSSRVTSSPKYVSGVGNRGATCRETCGGAWLERGQRRGQRGFVPTTRRSHLERNRSLPPSRDNHAVLWRINFGRCLLLANVDLDRSTGRPVDRKRNLASGRERGAGIAFDRSPGARSGANGKEKGRREREREKRESIMGGSDGSEASGGNGWVLISRQLGGARQR